MTSIARKLGRASIRRRGGKPGSDRPQFTEVLDMGYRTLRPTKGWSWISVKRLAAQQMVGRLLDHVVPVRPRAIAVLTPPPAATPCQRLSRDATAAERETVHRQKMVRKYGPAPVAAPTKPKRRAKKAA